MTDESNKVRTQVSQFVDPDDMLKIIHSEGFAHMAVADTSQIDQVSL